MYCVCSSLWAFEKSQKEQHCGQRENTNSSHCNASPCLHAQESAPCKARGKAICLWRQSLSKPKQHPPAPNWLSTLGCRPLFWHKEDRAPQAHHSRVHSCHPTFYNSNTAQLNPTVQWVILDQHNPKSPQTLPRLLLDGLGHLCMHNGESGWKRWQIRALQWKYTWDREWEEWDILSFWNNNCSSSNVTYQARNSFVTRDKGKSLHFQPLAIISIADTTSHRVKHSPVAV